jgi:hypothetical protein
MRTKRSARQRMQAQAQTAASKMQEQQASPSGCGMEGVGLNISHASPPLFTTDPTS